MVRPARMAWTNCYATDSGGKCSSFPFANSSRTLSVVVTVRSEIVEHESYDNFWPAYHVHMFAGISSSHQDRRKFGEEDCPPFIPRGSYLM